jgi:hypothetical protein
MKQSVVGVLIILEVVKLEVSWVFPSALAIHSCILALCPENIMPGASQLDPIGSKKCGKTEIKKPWIFFSPLTLQKTRLKINCLWLILEKNLLASSKQQEGCLPVVTKERLHKHCYSIEKNAIARLIANHLCFLLYSSRIQCTSWLFEFNYVYI